MAIPFKTYDPHKPNFYAEAFPRPNIRSMDNYAEAYTRWAIDSGVFDWVEGTTLRAVATDMHLLTKEPVHYGLFKGKERFLHPHIAKLLGITPVGYPEDKLSWLAGGTIRQTQNIIAYHQGSSEFGSSQQQNQLRKLGYMPPIFEKYARNVIGEEGEHGTQMGYWLGMTGGDFEWLLVEDLLARNANSDDPNLQQPLIEFNPPVETLPEMGHYFDKQDRDGWSKLVSSSDTADALYAGMMRYFLKQESKHLGSGQQIIELYLQAGRIPMDLHLKMEWEWSARAYRLHGNPYNSDGARRNFQIGSKNPILPWDRKGPSGEILTFTMPHPKGKNGFITVQITPEMDPGHLNGYEATTVRKRIMGQNDGKRSGLLSDAQRVEMRAFLEKVTMHVPEPARSEILNSGKIPTAEISWRPYHLAFIEDPWPHLRGYFTDVFGYPIPTEREYFEYRKLVDITPQDREQILALTRTKGWMVEFEPGSRYDVYKDGQVQPDKDDIVLYEFKVGAPVQRFKVLFTFPQAMAKFESERPSQKSTSVTGSDGAQTLWDLHDDIVGN